MVEDISDAMLSKHKKKKTRNCVFFFSMDHEELRINGSSTKEIH